MKLESEKERYQRYMASFGENHVWDEKTKGRAAAVRKTLGKQPQPTVSQYQRISLRTRAVPNESLYHIVEEEVPVPPQDDIRQLFLEAVRSIKDVDFTMPEMAQLQIEWISRRHRAEADDDHKASSLLTASSQTSQSPTANENGGPVMLHFHGGGHCQNDPKGYRSINAQLASLAGGHVASVRFRLAPQHAFPEPLLDAFLAYLSLIYSPITSGVKEIAPSRIVLIGDSSGAVLIFGLLQVIRYLNAHATTCRYFQREIQFPIPFPAGTAVISPYGEQIHSLPSQRSNGKNDVYPPETPWTFKVHPQCELWPTPVPRQFVACETDALRSPLNTPLLAQEWQGFPPMWFGVGQERWYDSAKVVARRAAQSDVKVKWVEYEGMPHCFPMTPGFNEMQQTQHLIRQWAQFCADCVTGAVAARASQVQASLVSFSTLEEKAVPLEQKSDPPLDDVDEMHETSRRDGDRAWRASSYGAPSKL